MLALGRTQKSSRIALILAVVGILKVSAAALLVSLVMTLYALSPDADGVDARVFLGIAFCFFLGGVAACFVALRAWRQAEHGRNPH